MIREILQEISTLLERHDSKDAVSNALHDETSMWDFLVSNELWGGAGSIADQALLEYPEDRKRLEGLLIRLGDEQRVLGRTNERTDMWVTAFKKWIE